MLLDSIFGRDCFLNEIVWAYDFGARTTRRWPAKHDVILAYVRNPDAYHFDSAAVDREPYMAPGLQTPERAARGKLPTDVWWHTIVPTASRERTGYPTQKPLGILRRIVTASSRPDDLVVDWCAGSGTTGVAAPSLVGASCSATQPARSRSCAPASARRCRVLQVISRSADPVPLEQSLGDDQHSLNFAGALADKQQGSVTI